MCVYENVELLFITPNSEKIIEKAGRICYNSLDRITNESCSSFIKNLIKHKHESVLEHAYASFQIKCSRACSHQLVRHRLASYSQKSQRYVNEENFDFIIPPEIEKNKEAYLLYIQTIKQIKEAYIQFRNLGIKKEDARFILPNSTTTELVMTANFREWRHILKLRLHQSSQWEIREIMQQICDILYEHAPSVFYDLKC